VKKSPVAFTNRLAFGLEEREQILGYLSRGSKASVGCSVFLSAFSGTNSVLNRVYREGASKVLRTPSMRDCMAATSC